MKLARIAFQSIYNIKANPYNGLSITTRTLSTTAFPDNGIGNNQNSNKLESADEFERRIFGGGGNSDEGSFFRKLDRLERNRNRIGAGGPSMLGDEDESYGDDESFDTLSDGMDGKLKNASMYFDFDLEEVQQDGYTFRPDSNFPLGSTYDIKDLDLRRPGVRKPPKRREFEVTTKEVLKKADFRNVRFLANFITDAGIIIKRSKTGISAKAQRKVAREIKTARAFGLMPFTTMGTKSFVFGKTMEDMDEDFEYEIYDSPNAGPDERGSF